MTFDAGLSSSAVRDLDALPPRIATAVVEFVFGPLTEDPRRLGKPLQGRLAGLHSARRGSYRMLYELDDERRRITVVRVAHRAHVYR